ncbi:MAG: T9SS type A sorting domain-containing protein [Candidatus Marinimicrobia bacterium]|nr:T9SS type A sorting domain-containing protein [Candidatus Neomarinimicrobiota bacterium]MBL7022965.1 T9SS type A sorting domain-containing protein [Candidatus Neomarinimicrobiota bacterium]
MKKKLTVMLVLCLTASFIFAKMPVDQKTTKLTTNKTQFVIPGKNLIASQSMMDNVIKNQMARQGNDDSDVLPLHRHAASKIATRDCEGCWDLSHVDETAEWYLGSGAASDTMAVAFTAAAPCIVQEVYCQWFDGGNITAFASMVSDIANENTGNTGASTGWPRGTAPWSPIGQMMTNPTPNTAVGDNSYELLDIGGTFQVGDESDLANTPAFMIIIIKGAETPHPLASDVADNTYLWFGGPWTDPDGDITTPDGDWGDGYAWGSYQSSGSMDSGLIDNMVLVKVTYPWGAPIASSASQLPNTYATTNTLEVLVDLFDDVDDASGYAINDDDIINFIYSVDGVETTLTLADALPVDVGAEGNGVYAFNIDYTGTAGTVIEYWLELTDNDGLYSETAPLKFEVKAPLNTDADLLIINDRAGSYNVDLYETVVADMGIIFETWNVTDNNGIDASVINFGWSSIVVYGWGTSTVPIIAEEEDPGYGAFLDAGGHLLLVDQDWFYGHALDVSPVFEAGDFAYDYFGLAGGENDPMDEEGLNSIGDTLVTSLIDGLFEEEEIALAHDIYGTSNWADYLYEGDGVGIFAGFDSDEIVGIQNGNATYLSFMADAAVDTLETGELTYDQFGTLLNYIITDFGVTSPPVAWFVDGPTGHIFTQEDQTVTFGAEDPDGDAFTVELSYIVNDGETTVVSTIDNGDGSFTGTIPGQGSGAVVDYFAVTTDDTGASYTTEVYNYDVYSPSSNVLFVLNNEMDPAGYPGLYYFYNSATGGLYLMPDFWVGAVVPELLDFYDTVFEIATTNTYDSFYDHYDVVHAWLQDGNKNYVLAGDELFYMLGVDGATEAGTFFNDLGIAEAHSDLSYPDEYSGTSPLYAVENDLISGDLFAGINDLGDGSELMYDPLYEIGLDYNWIDGMVATEDATPTIYHTATDLAVGVYKEWTNGNKTMYLGFDPLSLNSAPTYDWWGAGDAGTLKKALDWFEVLSISDNVGLIPSDFALHKNYPNPFNPVTMISFDIPNATDVQLKVYDLLGKEVATLFNEHTTPGTYHATWNGLDYSGMSVSSGVYFYRIIAGDFIKTEKMILLK